QIILTRIDNDIYSIVDACLNACEMWKAIERLKHGELINVQDLETNLYWEFGKFTSHDGESLESYYSRIACTANPLALVAQQQPVYHAQNHPTHYTQNSSTRSQQAATRNREKIIVNSHQPIYGQKPSMVVKDDKTSKNKEIDKLMALISLSFKKLYKPTNNNLLTSSNTSQANHDNSPRINRGVGYENQRIGNVVGARETVGTTVVQKSGIQCYNCKEFGYVAKECQKPKRVKDAAYHREKMLLYDESEDQELEAHYMYTAQIQEVSPYATDSRPIFDSEPVQKINQNDDDADLDNEHSLKSQLETQITQFLNEIDRLSREYYYADHMNAILGVYTELDEDLKAQLQDKGIVISELKKLIEKLKEKSVDTKFEKASIIRQLNAFKSQRPSILGKPTIFSDSLERKDFSKSKSVTQNNVSNDFLKPVTAQTLPPNKKSILKNTNVKDKQENDKIGTKPDKNGKLGKARRYLSCGALYTEDFCCSKENVEDKILVSKLPKTCARCGYPVNGPYCQRCTLLREKLEEDLVTYFQNFQNTSESSNGSTNIVNAPREPFVVKQDHGVNSAQNPPHVDECCCECGDALDGIFCQQCTFKSCGKVPCVSKPNFVDESSNIFNPPPQPPIYSCEFCGSNAQYGHYCTPQVPFINPKLGTVKALISRKIFMIFNNSISVVISVGARTRLFNKQEEKQIEEEQAANARYWKIPACCEDDDDYNSAITPVLSTEETDNSLSMGVEHLDTIPAIESDEVIKFSVEDLVPIPSESEGIPDTMCDVHLVNNPTPLEAKNYFEIIINSNDDISSSDDDSLYKENIEYVEASPHDSELVSLEVAEIVISKVEEIEDDNLREKLLNVNLLIAKIEALKDNPTSSYELLTKSSSTSLKSFLEETNTFHNSLPEFENFYFDLEEISSGTFYFDDDHIKEISSGSTTTHSDISLSEYDSFIFDLSNDQFPPTDRSDSTHEEFADELAHIISPPKYDCFYFRNLPNPSELIFILNSGIRNNLSTTSVNLPVEDDHSPLLAYVLSSILGYVKTLAKGFYSPSLKFLSFNWESKNFNGMSIEIRKKEKLLQQEQWAYLSTHPSKRLTSFCYDDDDDYDSAVTPALSTEEPVDSLSMGDEHLDTIPATESDEVIKSSVEDLVPIPSEFEGIPDTMCDVHLDNNHTPLEAKDQLEIVLNNYISSSENDSLHEENIEYVEASPHDSELVSLEAAEIVIPEVEEIEDDNLREKLLNVHLLFANIETLKDNPTPSSDSKTKSSSTSLDSLLEETSTFHNSLPEFENFYIDLGEISSGSTTTHSDISLPDYEAFYFDDDHIKKISSGSTTTHSDISLSEYDSFIFDLAHEDFVDELTHIISPPEYDCFYFRDLPDQGELMFVLNSGIRETLLFWHMLYGSFLPISRIPVNPLIDHHCCYECGNSLDDFFCHQCTCKFCGSGAHVGYNFLAQVPSFQTLPKFPQQYPCCEDCEVLPKVDHCQPPQYTVNHPIFNVHNDFLHSQNELTIAQNKLMEQMTQLTSMCEMACQIVQKKQEEKKIEEEQAAKAQNSKIPTCCDDDDDYNSAITPNEPVDSLSMGDEHVNTIPMTKSDEFIKSCVENLVPNPSKSEGENGCDVPASFTTFSNILFDAEYKSDSSDYQSCSDEDFLEEIFSNPLFEEEIIPMKIEHHHFNAESDLIESLLNRDSSIIPSSSKIDSLLDEFIGELTLFKSIPPGIDETDCYPKEDIRLIERLLYDNSSPCPPEEFVSKNSDADIESFSLSPIPDEDSDSHMEEIDLTFTLDDPMPPGIEEDDDDSERDVLIREELLDNYSLSLPEKSPDLLSYWGLENFQLSAKRLMMIHGKNIPILDVPLFHFYPLDQFKYGGNGSS
nr:hypothetical protein [Tanacetum cinerariifolium]